MEAVAFALGGGHDVDVDFDDLIQMSDLLRRAVSAEVAVGFFQGLNIKIVMGLCQCQSPLRGVEALFLVVVFIRLFVDAAVFSYNKASTGHMEL